ncbi:transcription initiation factor TFIID subunit 3 [Galendromus occidentalis]|uniref:Transcription initiation factor TFIID subunit 3 n=1 Tax=Galendromus occidentalis TaxID=34638 RepID=A0AAJ6VZF0_9ACAR|nr:transcription initiation factor TFIID subunit 3 [Galendromus occidentalis]
MSRAFSVEVLKVAVGHICQNIGWHNVSQTSLGILVDVLQKYMIELSKCTTSYANAAGRTESNTEDVFLAFRDFGLTERELLDYMLNVDSLPFPKKLPLYPIEQAPLLCFPKTQDPQKPEWIEPHLPSIRPDQEEETSDAHTVVPESPQVETTIRRTEEGASIKLTINKRAKGHESLVNIGDPVPTADEGTPMREVGAVLMTPSGYLSAIREGKLPDPCQPSKLLLDLRSDGDSSEEGHPSKSTKKKRKAKTAESKANKFFDEKVNGESIVTSIKIEKPVKEKKTKEPKRGKKRKSPGGRSPKAAKAPRLSLAEEKNLSPKPIPKVKLETIAETVHPEAAIVSDNESLSSLKLRMDDNCDNEDPTIDKDEKAVLSRNIDDAINSVVESARKSTAEKSRDDDRARKKLQVDDYYDYLSDSDMDVDVKSNADFSDRPKTPPDEPEVREKKVPTSGARKENAVKASPLVELVRQMPDQPTNEDSSSFLTPSVTITPIPPKPPTPTPPPPPPIVSTLTVKTLAERKGMPPIEVEDKFKKKDKKKERKDKKDKSKKKEVPKLTLKLSSASSLTEQLFAPTPLISTTPAPKEKEKEKEKKTSILKAMVNEVDSDSDDLSPVKMSSPPASKALRIKEPKKPPSNKKEKTTPSSKNSKVLSPLPVTPVHPEITITPIPAPSSKKDKKKPKQAIKKEEKEKKSKEKKDSKGAQVEVVTVGTTIDEDGNKIWICPACAKPDDGSPMIGCDQCDDWYHWECVGIDEPPSEDVQWFCTRCTKNKKPQKKHQKIKK